LRATARAYSQFRLVEELLGQFVEKLFHWRLPNSQTGQLGEER
jgi:hypothetical protein